LIEAARARYEEAVRAKETGDYELASKKASESITELERARTIEMTRRQRDKDRLTMTIVAIGVVLAIALFSFLVYRKKKTTQIA